jgi:pimeloyl-ACP methyl ester carboxylesterase
MLVNPSLNRVTFFRLFYAACFLVFAPLCFSSDAKHTVSSSIVNFSFEEETLNGVLTLPGSNTPKGIVLIVHGYGKTNAVAGNWYGDVRQAIHNAGFATYMWDKMGCGNSTGEFDIDQPVANSADEVAAAIDMLKANQIPGANTIGLWGISRAGWINPLVMEKRADIAFWISVSGVDGLENFGYLLEQNTIVEGKSPQAAKQISDEWLAGTLIAHKGGSYGDYKSATPHLESSNTWMRFTDGGIGRFGYFSYRSDYQEIDIDPTTGLRVYIKEFDALLAKIDVPVLAVFGEKDLNVDWRKTKALYERVFSDEQLTTLVLPNCNHNIFKAKTGGYFEFQDNQMPYVRCEGFLEGMQSWLSAIDTVSLEKSDNL